MSIDTSDGGLGSMVRLYEVGRQRAADAGRASDVDTDDEEGDDDDDGSEVGHVVM